MHHDVPRVRGQRWLIANLDMVFFKIYLKGLGHYRDYKASKGTIPF